MVNKMKYNIKYKGLDEQTDFMKKHERVILTIYALYKKLFITEPQMSFLENKEKFSFTLKENSGGTKVTIKVTLEPEKIVKSMIAYTSHATNKNIDGYRKFTSFELKLFDGLDFKLDEVHKSGKIAQDITDWYGKI
jgi:hypothetical protein